MSRLSSFKLRSAKRKNTRRTGSWKKRNKWSWRRAKRRSVRRKTRKRGRVPTRAWKDANDGLGGGREAEGENVCSLWRRLHGQRAQVSRRRVQGCIAKAMRGLGMHRSVCSYLRSD